MKTFLCRADIIGLYLLFTIKRRSTSVVIFALCLLAQVNAQEETDSITFEDLALPIDTFINDFDGDGPGNESVFFPNNFTQNEGFDSWSGWALSTMRDTLTPGFSNQYSSAKGRGVMNSNTYIVGFGMTNYLNINKERVKTLHGFYVNNSAYAYLSMKDGDQFAKKFGGPTGRDPDFFKLTIFGYESGMLLADSIEIFLADFRSDDSGDDYILKEWTWVDLTSLQEADSLHFHLSSSDVGAFGMNTPAYFCADHFIFSREASSAVTKIKTEGIDVNIYPNPATTGLNMQSDGESFKYALYDIAGRGPLRQGQSVGSSRLDLSSMPPGTYLLRLWNAEGSAIRKCVVRR